ncbi:hypothetical protein VP01_1633g7 [Puccinia sorghi]|uniref:C2H2-type domain-containing protein n=1 Tax=Puccinia sorghi TaxID=27349 RepID=A0A0L6VHE2_9BASI|nr:hypothetical protein VP01_1633g7 [Puccinia sorghi]
MSFHLHPSPSPVPSAQPSSSYPTATTRVANHLEIAASLWGHFQFADLSAIYPSVPPPPHSYQRSSISHVPDNDSFTALDFPSNVPSIWGYQTLLGFTPASLNQYNPYSISTTNLDQLQSSSSPSQSNIPYNQGHYFPPPPRNSPPTISDKSTTPSQPTPYYHHVPSSSLVSQSPRFAVTDQTNRNSPVFKMFKCMLDPNCEMEFTRAEHLARHERKHTKEKPFKCHCTKAFSRLDNWRQHKVSVHKEDVEQNALTEERLVQVHKSMQRQNNIRKAATLAAQKHDRFERCTSMTESSESAYSPAPTRSSGIGSRCQPQQSPFLAKTPDKAMLSQSLTTPFNNHSDLVSNTSILPENLRGPFNPSPAEVPEIITCSIPSESPSNLGTPLNNVVHCDAHTNQGEEYHQLPNQYPSRFINYSQISRAPLSSLWPTFQPSIPLTPTHLNSQSTRRANATNEMIIPMQRATHSKKQGTGLLFNMNDGVFSSHHSQMLSALTREQAAILATRKVDGGSAGQHMENRRGYSDHLVVAQNNPHPGSSPLRKRVLTAGEPFELDSNLYASEQKSVKKLRI